MEPDHDCMMMLYKETQANLHENNLAGLLNVCIFRGLICDFDRLLDPT